MVLLLKILAIGVNLERAAALLRDRGVAVNGPVFHQWMPAKSIYFSDPDGHDLELCAVPL